MMKSYLLLVGMFLLLAGQGLAAPVSGKVAVDTRGVAGIEVMAWPLASLDFSGDPPYRSAPSDADGHFELDVPPGEYYFLASGPQRFGYYGRNPVLVDKDGLSELKLALSLRDPQRPEGEPLVDAGVFGKLSFKGKPLEGVSLMFYTDLNTQLKGMGLGMTAPSDASGLVEAPLQPGTYFLVARKRNSGQLSGPLNAGDYFGYYADNPLVLKEGEVARIGIDMVEVPAKVKRLAASMFGQTSVSGRILNAVGSPVAGVRVLLYADSMMLNRPLYVSQPSGSDGRYVLSFPRGGHYFLSARDKLGGAPGPGELYGRYTGSQDSSIRIRTGQHLDKIDLLVQEMW